MRAMFGGLGLVIVCAAAACATGIIAPGDDAGTGTDATTSDAGTGCPQYDLNSDPNHCGSCTNKCSSTQVCSGGQCKAECAPPTVKCAGDAGVCVDLSTDPNNCGACGKACTTADAGLPPGNGNPDAGIPFDGGYDGGTGWSPGTPTCAANTCGVTCPSGMTACSDQVCYDLQNFHGHCGDCNTACQTDTEWCTSGKCCPLGQEVCNGACTDVLGNASNCGACGNVCPSNAPFCSNGVCSSGVVYTDSFTTGVIATTQCTDWQTFQSQLTGTYTSITISGSNDPTGVTCTGAVATQLCAALHNNATVSSVSCDGHTWAAGTGCGSGMAITATDSVCGCTSLGYYVRPCIGSTENWGAVNSTTSCFSPPSQTITVVCK